MLIILIIFTGKDVGDFIVNDENIIKVEEISDAKTSSKTVVFSSSEFSIDATLKRFYAVYSFQQNLEDISIIYAYSPVLRGLEFIDKKPVNLAIYIDKDLVYVSNPINLGSF